MENIVELTTRRNEFRELGLAVLLLGLLIVSIL